MKKSDYVLEDGVIAQNEKYILKALREEDKENYLNLYQENSIVANTTAKIDELNYESFAEFVWSKMPEDDAIYVSVFLRKENIYVGNITMQHLNSDTPEIGIDVLQKYQRKGSAYESIPLFAKRVQELRPIEYFMVRVYSDNEPSRKLFEKLGAVQIGEEPSEFATFLMNAKETMGEKYDEMMERYPQAEMMANMRHIIQYKYIP